eukprot:1162559-Pleurochrysis_carterae.AAC.1
MFALTPRGSSFVETNVESQNGATLGTQQHVVCVGGGSTIRPRLTPTQARGSKRVLEYAGLGLTA